MLRAELLSDLSNVAHSGTEDIYKANVLAFLSKWQAYKEVCDNFKANWESCGKHWAHFGRQEVLHLQRHTNNHLERFQGIFKYDFLARKTNTNIPALINILVTKVCIHVRSAATNKGSSSSSSTATAAVATWHKFYKDNSIAW
jgi:hypothetical protein